MTVIKRNGTEVDFDIDKIVSAVSKANDSVGEEARLTPLQIRRIAEFVELSCLKMNRAPSVEEIQDLVEQGLVAKYVVDGTSSACFEYLGHDEHCHKHICFHCKCEKCGKVIHLECGEMTHLGEHMLEDHGFQWDFTRTVFYGICEECRGK